MSSATATCLGQSADRAVLFPNDDLISFVPENLRKIKIEQTDIPELAKKPEVMSQLEVALQSVPTDHYMVLGDARRMSSLSDESVHLVLTSPPYWTLKEYHDTQGQLGHIADYEQFLSELEHVWRRCFDLLVPGGRLICVVGDVCLSRRKNEGRHSVIPLHSSIQESARRIGFDNLAPIIWHKIANAVYEVAGAGGFLGKPYEPNSVVKNDIEYILMLRKPGGYRKPDSAKRLLSIISAENYQAWFQQVWTGLTGASTKHHPAPYPLELAVRLIRMFSFAGDIVLDPFSGTGTTSIAAAKYGRNSVGYEISSHYHSSALHRVEVETASLFNRPHVFGLVEQ